MISKVMNEISAERQHQQQKWGDAFDDNNTVNDWGTYIGIYLARATTMQATKLEQREALVKVATLAVAAVETFDRNEGFARRHYDKG